MQTERPVDPHKPPEKTLKSGWWRPVFLVGILIVVIVLARVFDVGERLGALRDWIASLGGWGPFVFALFYIIAVVGALPGSALTVAAGALFGSIVGVVLVSIASTVGASICFLIARYFARDVVARLFATKEKFRRLDRLTEAHGAVIVALTRLVPMFPFNIVNYGFGLTKVRFWTYVFWSWLCMIPGTILYVVGADAFIKGIAEGRVPWGLIGGGVAAGMVLAVLIRYARRRLRAKEKK